MTLQQQAVQAVRDVPDDKLPFLIQFANFLSSPDVSGHVEGNVPKTTTEKRRSISGILKGRVQMTDDFSETPDCFKEYV